METSQSIPISASCISPAGVDVAGLVKTTVIEAISLQPAEFDWKRSLAEMGCDSLSVIDIQYELEKKLGVRDLGLGGPLDFDPLRDPLSRLEQHVRAVFRPA